uniref:Amine oxidase domain-containing protein n=1 Tax=Salix viminalis TaxID=40686 RepID=A0A6N2MAQ8_SALVM
MAVQVFKKMEQNGGKPNVVTYNTIIDNLCKDRLVNEAMEFLSEMLDRGIQPNVVTYNSIVHGFCNLGQLNEATRLFKEMVGKDDMPDTVTFSILVDGLCKEGMVSEAQCVFDIMPEKGVEPDVITYNALTNGLCNEGKIKDAVELFNLMVQRGYEPNVITYNTIINGLFKSGNRNMAVQVFKKMEQNGGKPNVVTYNTIIDNLCKHRLVNDAMEFLSEMLDRGIQPNVLTYSSIVHGFCNLGQLNEATRLFKEMVGKDVMPDTVTFTILVDGLCKEGMVSEARRVFETMPEKGVEPNVYTYNALMDGYCLRREMNEAKKVFEIMVRNGCAPNVHSYNILINGYCKSRRMEEAKSLLAEMSHKALPPDTVGRPQEALNLFKEMCSYGLLPDLTTYSILLDGFCKHGHLDEALKLLKAMQEKKLEPNIVLYNILIEDVVTYNSIVHGFCNLGQLNEATRLFKEMVSRDVMPNTVTFTILVDGLCKEGMVSEARRVFETMTEKGPYDKARNAVALALSPVISFSDWFLSKGGTRMSIQRMWDPVAYALGFIDCDNISARCMLTIFSLFATKTEASLLRMLKGSPDVYLSILYDRSPDGEILVTGLATSKMEGNGVCKVMAGSRLVHQTSEKSDCATDKKVVKADAYVVACDVPGIKRLLPSQWRESKFFDNIYELVGVPVVTVQLRYNGWVTELQDLERSRQLRQASGLDNLLYTPDADFSCFADLALTSPEDYYIEGQGSLLQCVLTPGDPYMSLTNDKIIERVSKQALVTSEFKMFGLTEHLSLRLPSFLLTFCMGAHMVLALFPSSQGLEVIWSSVVKIAQSLYREGPGKDPFRPDQKTPVKNFFLAGSYTKQGVRQQAALASNKFDRNHSS